LSLFKENQYSNKETLKNTNSGSISAQCISHPEFFFNESKLSSHAHSQEIDQIIGFRILRIERKLIQKYRSFHTHEDFPSNKEHHSDEGEIGESWIGLNPQVLLTPYSDLYDIFYILKDEAISSVIDIGCAYGRVGIVAKAFFPMVHFTGYEIVKKRVAEAERINLKYELEFNILNQNVLDEDFKLPDSSLYFIYDFSHFMHIRHMLEILEAKIGHHPFILIARGENIRGIIQFYFPLFLTKKDPIYCKDWSIFFLY